MSFEAEAFLSRNGWIVAKGRCVHRLVTQPVQSHQTMPRFSLQGARDRIRRRWKTCWSSTPCLSAPKIRYMIHVLQGAETDAEPHAEALEAVENPLASYSVHQLFRCRDKTHFMSLQEGRTRIRMRTPMRWRRWRMCWSLISYLSATKSKMYKDVLHVNEQQGARRRMRRRTLEAVENLLESHFVALCHQG